MAVLRILKAFIICALWTNLLAQAADVNDMPATKNLDTIVVGAGCFWGVEKRFEAINGVVDAVSGYAGGNGFEPDYETVSNRANKNNPNNFAEVVQITYNPKVVGLDKLLKQYFEMHDPTQLNRQGNDIGTQYRSIILTTNKAQIDVAQQVRNEYQTLLTKAGYGTITTQIKPLTKFYSAEKYHQDYLAKNPNGYCPDHSTGVRFDGSNKAQASTVDNSALLKGKHVLVIDAEDFCPYCKKFKADVTQGYKGDIPLDYRFATQLAGLSLKTPTWATPTIIFLQDGKEIFGRQGYMSPEQFYVALGKFKLESEAFSVAFEEGTDSRFCKQYDIFKNTPDGVFVDKLSGAPLFDTKDRFNSGTGWLSFTKPVKDSVLEQADDSYGMHRTAIRAKISGIHLGHVFNDGPDGKPRYCINATVLDFVPRSGLK